MLRQRLPQAVFASIGIHFLNRGAEQNFAGILDSGDIDREDLEDPSRIEHKLAGRARNEGIPSASLFYDTAWLPSQTKVALQTVLDPGLEPRLLNTSAMRLTAIALGNPFIIAHMINFACDPDNQRMTPASLESLSRRLGIALQYASGETSYDFYHLAPIIDNLKLLQSGCMGIKASEAYSRAFGGFSQSALLSLSLLIASRLYPIAFRNDGKICDDFNLSLAGKHEDLKLACH